MDQQRSTDDWQEKPADAVDFMNSAVIAGLIAAAFLAAWLTSLAIPMVTP